MRNSLWVRKAQLRLLQEALNGVELIVIFQNEPAQKHYFAPIYPQFEQNLSTEYCQRKSSTEERQDYQSKVIPSLTRGIT